MTSDAPATVVAAMKRLGGTEPGEEPQRMVSAQESTIEYPGVSGKGDSRFWSYWLIALLAVFALRLPVLDIFPLVETDEVWILDIGRTTLNPHTDWSVNWIPGSGPPQHWLYGPVLPELAYRLFPGSPLGPRGLSLVGALLAATLLVAWLRERRVEARGAWLMGVAFLLDPLFSMSYGGARVDCWAFALCFGAAWLIRKPYGRAVRTWADLGAGALAASATMVWPTAWMLWPLLLVELLHANATGVGPSRPVSSAVRRVANAALGGVAALAILLLPEAGRLAATGRFARALLTMSVEPVSGFRRGWLQANALGLVVPLKRSPFIVMAALLGVFTPRTKLLTTAAAGCALLFLVTLGFLTRDIYLLPYLAALATSPLRDNVPATGGRAVRCVAVLLLVCAAVWAVGLSAVARPLVAWRHRGLRNPAMLTDLARAEIGPGPHRVLVRPYEFYYSGRQLGWRMFHVLLRNSFADPRYRTLLDSADYAIVNTSTLDGATLRVLELAGLRARNAPSWPPTPARIRVLGVPLFSDLDRVYGPYTFFARGTDRTDAQQPPAVDSLGRQTPASKLLTSPSHVRP